MEKPTIIPGTQEALDVGCLCPILDNSHGKGYMGLGEERGLYVYNGECPIHGSLVPQE